MQKAQAVGGRKRKSKKVPTDEVGSSDNKKKKN